MILTSRHMMALANLPQQGRHSNGRPAGKGVFICLKAKDS